MLTLCLAGCGSNTASDNSSQEGKTVSTYFTVQASRDNDVKIPVGVTVPALSEGETCPVVVMVHGFLGSKDEEFGFFANNTDESYDYPSIAEELATRGIGTIRIDQAGMGESKDSYLNYTLDNSVSDLEDAYQYCLDHYSFDKTKVGLVGWSMGGKVGPKFASNHDEISTMVLQNPAGDNGNTSLLTAAGCGLDWKALESQIKDGKCYLEVASGFVGKDVYLSYDFFKQVDNSKTGDEIKEFTSKDGNNALLIYGDKDSIINPDTYSWLVKNSGAEYVCIPGMDHDLGLESNRPDYTNIVVDETVSYLVNFLNY